MEKARAAVSGFVGKSGHHDTKVDERQAPAVQREEVKPTQHENITTAVDREVHQDHFHTTVQPVKDQEILPEKHSHQMAGVQHKEVEHANPQDTRARLDSEAQQFKDTSTTHNTKYSKAVAPTVEGERVHHHVHETIQPVIEKETIAPSVVHTTVPIHETHQAAPEHHGASILPTKTMADFKNGVQDLSGSKDITNEDKYDGCPRPYNPKMQMGTTHADGNPHSHTSGSPSQPGSTSAGDHNSNLMNKADPRIDSDRDGRGMGTGMTGTSNGDPNISSDGYSGQRTGAHGQHDQFGGADSAPVPAGQTTSHGSGASDTASHKKPSLMDRLNPKKDADHDGQKGLMK